MKPFNIRNADFEVVARARGLKEVLMMLPELERIDIWPGAGKACQIGLCWAGGSTAIFDFPDIVEAAKVFSETIAAGKPAPIFHAARSSI